MEENNQNLFNYIFLTAIAIIGFFIKKQLSIIEEKQKQTDEAIVMIREYRIKVETNIQKIERTEIEITQLKKIIETIQEIKIELLRLENRIEESILQFENINEKITEHTHQ